MEDAAELLRDYRYSEGIPLFFWGRHLDCDLRQYGRLYSIKILKSLSDAGLELKCPDGKYYSLCIHSIKKFHGEVIG